MRSFERRAVVVALLAVLSSPVWAQETSLDGLKSTLMCNCGCPHLLGQCGDECGVAPQLIQEVEGLLAEQSEEEVYRTMGVRYGQVIYGAPRAEGWGLMAWLLPVFALAFGGLVVWGAMQRLRADEEQSESPLEPEVEEQYRSLLRKELREREG